MSEGSQKFIARNRAPRVQIEYDVELYGSEKKVQLPFVMGVMSDLAGKSRLAQPAVEDRSFLEIDVDNFDDRMKAMQPRAAFSVPNTLTGEGNLSVDLTFEKMEDFTPAAIASKIAPLRDLLQARTQLSNLATYMDGKAGAEALIENILADPSLLSALAQPGAAPDVSAALDSLRAARTAQQDETDESGDILASLRANAPADTPEADRTGDILAGLSQESTEAEPQGSPDSVLDQLRETNDQPEVDPAAASDTVLAGLRSDAPPEDPAVDATLDDALASLAAPPQAETEQVPDIADVLASVPDTAQTEQVEDGGDAVLADLAAATPSVPDLEDTTRAVLESLPEAAPVDDMSPDADMILGSLPGQAGEKPEDQPDLDSVLSSIEEALAAPSEPPEDVDSILGELAPDDTAPMATEQDPVPAIPDETPDPPLQAPPPDLDDLDDLLGDAPTPADVVPEPDVLEPPVAEDLSDLDDLLGEVSEQTAVASNPETADPPTDDDIDDLDDLDDLLGDDADQPDPAPDSHEAVAPEPDDLAGLDDLDDLLGDASEPQAAEAPATDDLAGLDDLDDLLGDPEASPASEVTAQAMVPEFAFGTLTADRPSAEALARKRFRIAILGDFSGRAARGDMATGDTLATRVPILLDPDTVEEVIEGFATRLLLPIGKDGATVEVALNGLDDLHPDELYDSVALFSELAGLRARLATGATAESAARDLRAWGEAHGAPVTPPRRTSSGSAVPADLKLTDFQNLIGDTRPRPADPTPLDDLMARIVGPHVRSVPDADTVALQAAVDDALSAAMRMVLHHPEFQSVEAQWRALDLIARSIEVDDTLEVMLYDVSAEEIAADLATAPDLAQSGFARLLTEVPMDADTGRGGYSALIGLYTFEETPPHADILGRIARVAAHVDAPFLAALSPGFLDIPKDDRHPLVADAWDSLRALPEAGHLGLAAPRFLLRRPYGVKTDPVSAFKFEEFTMAEGLGGMLWANPVVLVAILLAKSYRENGASVGLGSIMSLGQMPYHVVTDRHGDQVALPCTERNLTLEKVEKVMTRGVMPVVSMKGRDEIRLASFQSLAGGDILGPWSGVAPPPPSPPKPAPAKQDDDDLGLDDLLAGFDDATDDTDAASDDIDADLAALLEDL